MGRGHFLALGSKMCFKAAVPNPQKKKRLEAAVLKNEKGLLIIIAYFIYVDDWLRLPILKKTVFIIVSDNKGAM